MAARPTPIKTPCADSQAIAKVVERAPITYNGDNSPLVNCPADTDKVLNIGPDPDTGVTQHPLAPGLGFICLRNLRPPHEGRPGHGGGVMVVGDCLRKALGGYEEVACNLAAAEYKIDSDDPSCPKGQIEVTAGKYRQVSYCARRL